MNDEFLCSFDLQRDRSRDKLGRVHGSLCFKSPTRFATMALVDFYQLAVLYNLSRGDAGVLPNCSDPPYMFPAATAPLSAVEPNPLPLFSTRPPGVTPSALSTRPPVVMAKPRPCYEMSVQSSFCDSPHSSASKRGPPSLLSKRPPPAKPKPLPVSPTIPLSAIEPDQVDFPVPPSKFKLQTPERSIEAPVPHPTPVAVGTAIKSRLQPDTDEPEDRRSSKFEDYISQDFDNHRIFVDIEVFMKSVLHVPENWRKLWGPTIDRIKCHPVFTASHLDYIEKCGKPSTLESEFYDPLVRMGNAILDFSKQKGDPPTKPITPQRYLRNDHKKISGGVINKLCPDIVTVHEGLLDNIEDKKSNGLEQSALTWANTLQVLELKHRDGALVDGCSMPRLKVNGKPATSSDNDFRLMRNRTRPKGLPHLPTHAVTAPGERHDSPGRRYRDQKSIVRSTQGARKAGCGRYARTRSEGTEAKS